MSYNPFDKPIGETLTEPDLQVLLNRHATEGYFLEFKRQLPSQREKIAHSIASFANTYGGWYLVGVEGGAHNEAVSIAGFGSNSGNHDPISVITESVKVGIDPTPVFHAHVVTLGSGNLVAVVHVPEGQASPFITKDGRIYRRTHDSSAPVPESSRYAIDDLVRRGEKSREAFKRFATDGPVPDPRWPDEDSRVCVYISPAPLGIINRTELTRGESIEDLLKRSRAPIPLGKPFPDGLMGQLPLDSVFVSGQSVILRQVPKGREGVSNISVQLDEHGRCAIRFPIDRIFTTIEEFQKITSKLCLSVMNDRVRPDLEDHEQPLGVLHFFDISQLWLGLSTLIVFYLDWLKPTAAVAKFDVAVEAIAVRRAVAFYDSDPWGEHVQKYGLPVTLSPRSRIPEFSDGGYRIPIDAGLWVHVCSMVGRAFGLSTETTSALFHDALYDAVKKHNPLPPRLS